MADASTTLLYRFLGLDEGAGAQFDRMAVKTKLLGDASLGAAGRIAMLAKGAGVAAVVLGVTGVAMAMKFQRAMTLVQTQAGATADQVKMASKALLDMAGSVGTSPDQLAVAFYHAFSVTRDYAESLRITKMAAEGAKIGNTDLEQTINSLTATVASGIRGTKNYGQSMGTLLAIVGSGDMKMSDLNEALSNGILAISKAYNVTVQQVGAALAVFGDNNIRGADAATKLRMSIMDLAKPAATAGPILASIGLSAQKLQNDLANGGLTQALHDLYQHMVAGGIQAKQFGTFLTEAFTKRAGTGLAVLLEEMDRYNHRLTQITDASTHFGSAWQATTHTAAFAFDQLRAKAEALLITMGTHLLPVFSAAAHWLSTDLPKAVATLQNILSPLEHIVGGVLVVAWRVFADIVKVAASALSAIAGVLERNRALFTALAVTVGTLWVAFKGYTVLRLVVGLFETMALKAMYAKDAVAGAATQMGNMSNAALGGRVAMAAVAVGIGLVTMKMQEQADQQAKVNAVTQSYFGLLQQTKGAINNVVVAQVTQNLATSGAYQVLQHYGIGLNLVTQAALGNRGALAQLNSENKSGSLAYRAAVGAVNAYAGSLGIAQHEYRMATAAAQQNSIANDKVAGALPTVASAAQSASHAIAGLVTAMQNLVNTEISQMQTEDGFKEGLRQLAAAVKSNGDSLSQNTMKGLQNRDALLAVLSSAEKAAEGSRNYKQALIDNIKSFQTFAVNAGYGKKAVDNLLSSMHLMPKQIRVRISLNTADVAAGLSALVPEMSAAGQNAAQAMKNSFALGMGIHSPSKVFRDFGRMLALGLISGWKDGTASLKDALSSPIQAALNRLTTVVSNAIAKQAALLKTAQSNLKNLLSQRQSAIGSLAGNISTSSDLSNLFGTDVFGNPTTANINTFLSGQASQIENFAKDLKWGRRHGLSGILLTEIAGLGAAQGDQVLKQFMSGAASITGANQAEATIQRYATAGATSAEDALYAKRVAADRKAVHENTIELRELTKALHQAERGIARQASLHMTIDAKTGKPVVDEKFIKEIIAGIRRLRRISGSALI